jgi:ketosteroid isomerase-like protein
MPALSPEDTVRLVFEARAEGDLRRLLSLFAPDVEIEPIAGAPAIVGIQQAERYLDLERADGIRIELEAHRIVTDGDRAHVYGRRRVFKRGSLSDSPASWTFTVRDGRIARVEPLAADRALQRVA